MFFYLYLHFDFDKEFEKQFGQSCRVCTSNVMKKYMSRNRNEYKKNKNEMKIINCIHSS